MKLSIILTTLLHSFATSPDLCGEVYVDSTGTPYSDWAGQTLSRYCSWTGPDVPVFAADVCCSFDPGGVTCTVPDVNGRCWSGEKRYCKYGERVANGVVCYQPLPDACEAGFCVQAPEVPPPGLGSHVGCCSEGGVCQLVEAEQIEDCQGYYVACESGMTIDEQTVECYD